MPAATHVRDHLVASLEADLVGPFEDEEVLHLPPSRWYLTGFLAAMDARLLPDPEDDDVLGAGSDLDADDGAPADGGAKSPRTGAWHLLLLARVDGRAAG